MAAPGDATDAGVDSASRRADAPTLGSLPAEIVLATLRHLWTVDETADVSAQIEAARGWRATLLPMTLICRSWRVASQDLLDQVAILGAAASTRDPAESAARSAALRRYEDAETARRVLRVYVTLDVVEGSAGADALMRFTEIRVLAAQSALSWLGDLRATFPRLVSLSTNPAKPSVFDIGGLTRLSARQLRGPGESDHAASADTLRSLTVAPTYSANDAPNLWHSRADVGLLLVIRTAINLHYLHWQAPYPVELGVAFVGREQGRLRTLRLLGISDDPGGTALDLAAVALALPSSVRSLEVSFEVVHERESMVYPFGTVILDRLGADASFLPNLATLALGACGSVETDSEDEAGEDGEVFVATRARARQVAALRGIELKLI